MNCSKCGYPLPDGSQVCSYCGNVNLPNIAPQYQQQPDISQQQQQPDMRSIQQNYVFQQPPVYNQPIKKSKKSLQYSIT